MAAVSFLETTNLVGLGLSADKVLSPQQQQQQRNNTDAVGAQQGGLKLMSDVMDSSYRMFDGIGKLWQRDGPITPSQFIHSVNNSKNNNIDGPLQKFLDKKSVDDLKIGEVAELLADYKRLAAIIKQANLS
ncbi:hypothetical protein BDC45DRAFT_433202 [Circinella umbellata]|nr:hypothetical protein BDC45DRAFT_433202 [Circinella umbellata]